MSYGAAERSPIDIDEFERRMRAPGSRPSSDPLAELARLVNASEQKPDALDEMFARPGTTRAVAPVAHEGIDLDALRGPYPEDAHFEGQAHEHEAHYADDRYAPAAEMHNTAPAVDADWSVPQSFERPVPEAREPRSRKPLYAAAAVIAVGILGVGSTFAFKGSRSTSGDVVEVKAAPGPVKVAAQAGPDRTNGAADSTLLDRNAPNQPVTRVVDRQERPVDLKDAGRAIPRIVSTTPSNSSQMASLAAAAASGNDAGASVFSEPRRVKTVAVRPDGTVMSNTSVDAQPPMGSAASQTGAATSAAKGATPKAAARVVAITTPKPADKPEAAAPVRTAAAKPEATAIPVATKPAAPKPVRTARAAPAAADDDATDGDATAATAPRAASSGGFSIQLAAPGSEAEAKSTASKLGQKYSDALGGARVTVQKASDKSVYRVRTASMSREDAVAACEKIKASGGNCFVAKN